MLLIVTVIYNIVMLGILYPNTVTITKFETTEFQDKYIIYYTLDNPKPEQYKYYSDECYICNRTYNNACQYKVGEKYLAKYFGDTCTVLLDNPAFPIRESFSWLDISQHILGIILASVVIIIFLIIITLTCCGLCFGNCKYRESIMTNWCQIFWESFLVIIVVASIILLTSNFTFIGKYLDKSVKEDIGCVTEYYRDDTRGGWFVRYYYNKWTHECKVDSQKRFNHNDKFLLKTCNAVVFDTSLFYPIPFMGLTKVVGNECENNYISCVDNNNGIFIGYQVVLIIIIIALMIVLCCQIRKLSGKTKYLETGSEIGSVGGYETINSNVRIYQQTTVIIEQ